MKKINLILLLLLGVLYAQSVPQLHQRVQNQYQNLSSFQAEVEQSNYFAQLKRSIVFKGKIYFSPQRMLMHFSNPSVQRLQINAGKVQLYDASSNTLLNSSMLPEFGKMNPVEILQHYWTKSQVRIVKQSKGMSTIELVPTKDPMIKNLQATLDSKSGLVHSLSYEDPSGNKVTYRFSGIKLNQNIPASVWIYDYPKDVQIINQ